MYKMMIIDDEPIIRQGIKKSIDWENHGVEIIAEARNGKSALDKINKLQPDIIITDIRMPEMNGLEMAAEIRKNNQETKIIVLSGYDKFEYAKKSISLNVAEYLLNPFGAEELVEVVLRLIANIEEKKSKDESDLNKGKNPNYSKTINKAITYVQKNYQKEITLNKIADKVFVTPNYFSRIFKEEVGENFTSWVNKYRVAQAKKMIKNNREMKFYQISEAVGFNDYKYFSTIFKKYTKMTPSEYKRKL